MNEVLFKWIYDNKDRLYDMGIITEEIMVSADDVEEPFTRVDQCTSECVGRICAWKDGTIDFEVLKISSEERLMMEHYEGQSDVECFIEPYIKIIINDQKI